ncbi:XRE family transcriptional regulator [Martelella sp. HB161492]|uniref:LexA family protein n=1 Tax=Martelella sp. HB161492 TaxID=2720726 RepID=UPI00159281B4|nr:XRE family transcriptional regulator [Martelella sp. HB161492]
MVSTLDKILERIQAEARAKKISLRQLALRADFGPDLFRDWKRGKANMPSLDTIGRIANILGCSAGWLAYGEPSPGRKILVPVVSFISAGKLAEPNGATVRSQEYIELPENSLRNGNWIALRVEGDSMDLYSPPGSIIFVNRNECEAIDGGFYVFATDDGDATYKRFRQDPDRLEPESTNREHKTIYPTNPLTIIGRVRHTLFTFPA